MISAVQHQIVHESETQRQHARLALPSHIAVSGKDYDVKDISPGGAALRNVDGRFSSGEKIPVELKLPFGAFSLSIPLRAEVRHFDAAKKILGCRFIDLQASQLSLLNHIVKSFMAGEILSSADALSIAARNNFTKVRAHANKNSPPPGFLRQLPGLLAVLGLGLLIVALIGGNLYNSLFVVKAPDAAVSAATVPLRAAAEGVYRTHIDPEFRIVQKNQLIGTIASADGRGATVNVVSPCDCYVARQDVADGEFAQQGTEIASLVPVDAKPWVIAQVEPSAASKIASGAHADVSVFGSRTHYAGRVAGMESGSREGARTVAVKVLLDQKLPIDSVGRPASVSFDAR